MNGGIESARLEGDGAAALIAGKDAMQSSDCMASFMRAQEKCGYSYSVLRVNCSGRSEMAVLRKSG